MALLPSYIGRISEGVYEHLNGKVLHYVDDLGGVLLSYSRPRVLQSAGKILDEQPHVHFELEYTAHVFRPRVGSVLCGVVNNIGDDHIGCLVYDCFNVAINMHGKHRRSKNRAFLLNCEVGKEVRFCVTELEIVAEILSIKGELLSSSSTSCVVPTHHHRKRHKSSGEERESGHRKRQKSGSSGKDGDSSVGTAAPSCGQEREPNVNKRKKAKHK